MRLELSDRPVHNSCRAVQNFRLQRSEGQCCYYCTCRSEPKVEKYHVHLISPLKLQLTPSKLSFQVYHRDTDEVSRQEVYNILSHAGFIPRRPLHYQPEPGYQRYHSRKNNKKEVDLYDIPFLHNPDFLQSL